MSHWTPGQRLKDGKYIVEKLLNFGGFGVTYRAREQPSGKLVAIKTLNALQQSKSDFAAIQEKFVQEAFRLVKCSHPNIVQAHTVFLEDELWCMVMEYIEGPDLASYLEDRGVLSEEEALRIIRQVGEALSYVHNQGFLHRDVKPPNIILRRDSLQAVLIDFGLAREFTPGKLQSLTNHKTEYFAPIEQYERRGNFGAYTDVYALAATLYVLLTGELPFSARVRQHNIPLVPPKQHNPQISDRMNDAILKGMALEPKDRPQSVQEWLALLTSPPTPLLVGEGSQKPPLRRQKQANPTPPFPVRIPLANGGSDPSPQRVYRVSRQRSQLCDRLP
jgi:serine/threonine protein kinase